MVISWGKWRICSLPVHRDGVGGEDFFAFPDHFLGVGIVGEDAGAAPFGGFAAGFWDPLFVGGDNVFEAGLADEVGPFVGVLDHVVEFFAAVGVANVAPVFGADAVVVVVVGGDGGSVSFGGGVFELREETEAFEVRGGGIAGEDAEGGVDVEEFGGLAADPLGDSGAREDEGDAGAVIPEAVFSGDALFAEVPSVVGPEDDDGVVGEAIAIDGVHNFANLVIDEGGAGEIAAGEVHPFVMFFEPPQARFGKGPVHVPGKARGVVAVAAFDDRELCF